MGCAKWPVDPLFIGGETAVEFWRKASHRGIRPVFAPSPSYESVPDLRCLAANSYDLRPVANLRGCLHVYVSKSGCVPGRAYGVPFSADLPDPRCAAESAGRFGRGSTIGGHRATVSGRIIAHKQTGPLPEGSYCQVSSNVYIASPAFALVQCAENRPLGSLMQLGYELCGMYAMDPLRSRGYIERLPLTDSAEISSMTEFVAAAKSVKGIGKLKVVARKLIDGIRCPSAAALCSLFCAPAGGGGYALPVPRAGVPFRLVGDEMDDGRPCRILIDLLWSKMPIRPDMDWVDGQSIGVIVSDGEAISNRRIIELYDSSRSSKGISFVCLSISDLQSPATCNAVAKMIREVIGCRNAAVIDGFEGRNETMRSNLMKSISLAS